MSASLKEGPRHDAVRPVLEAQAPPPREGLSRIAEVVAVLLAPLTVVSALLLYVGWVRTRAYFGYFGVSVGLLGFSPQDFVLRSADVGLGAVVLVGMALVVLLGLDRLFVALLDRVKSAPAQGRTCLLLAVLGLGLVVAGLGGAIADALSANAASLVGAGLTALGATLVLRFGVNTRVNGGILGPATMALACLMLVLSALWALNVYARNLGEGAARDVERGASAVPIVTVYSDQPLDLSGSSIIANRLPAEEGKWHYRYAGALLLNYSNNRWFLVTEPPSADYRASVTVLQDNDTIHVESYVPR